MKLIDVIKSPIFNKMNKKYGPLKVRSFPKRLAHKDYKKDVLANEQIMIQQYKFTDNQARSLIAQKPSIVLFEEDYHQKQSGLKMLWEFLVEEKGMKVTDYTQLILSNPGATNRTYREMEKMFNVFKYHSIDSEEGFKILLQCPKLANYDFAAKLKERHFLFELYCGFHEHETMKIFRGFPHMMVMDHRKLTLFCGQFKKYRFTKKQIIFYCNMSGGLLGGKVSNLTGIMNAMLSFGITNKQTQKIFDTLPEFILLNRRDMLHSKTNIIMKTGGRDKSFIKLFILRHPDLFLK